MIFIILLTLFFFLLNTAIISILFSLETLNISFISTLLTATVLLWIFIVYTDFWPRIQGKQTLYDKLDTGFERLQRTKLLPNFSAIIKPGRGPTKYFMLLFFISLLIGSFLQKLGSAQGLAFSIVSFTYIVSLTFLANVPAFILSLNYIKSHGGKE